MDYEKSYLWPKDMVWIINVSRFMGAF